MSKKHKKNVDYSFLESAKSKKEIKKDMRDVIDEIEMTRLHMYEVDKRGKSHKDRKSINRTEKEFIDEMNSIKCREKIFKKWKKNGMLDTLVNLLKELSPLVKTLAKAVASFITLFLSLDAIKSRISPKFLEKMLFVFDLAMAI